MKKLSLITAGVILSGMASAITVEIDPQNANGVIMYKSQLDAAEAQAAAGAGAMIDLVKHDLRMLPNEQVLQVAPGAVTNPSNVKRVESILPESQFEYLFPHRNPAYTYQGFLQAVAKFPAYCGDYNDGRDALFICKKTLATTFAHFVQETGANTADPNQFAAPIWRQGLYWVREMYQTETGNNQAYSKCTGGHWATWRYPCGKQANGDFKSYFGRGAKQLSWNYNYGAFSEYMFGDATVLLNDPAQVADTWLNFASAIFFYVYPQPPKPSMLHVIDGTWKPNAADRAAGLDNGLGTTINIINGAFECGKGSTSYQAANRIAYYKEFSNYLQLDITGEQLDCANQKGFTTEGAGALKFYWDKDWGYNANTPGNDSFACKVVNYQWAYNALNQGDYAKCVEYFFAKEKGRTLTIIDDTQTGPTPTKAPVPSTTPTPVVVTPTPVVVTPTPVVVTPTPVVVTPTPVLVTPTPVVGGCGPDLEAWTAGYNWSFYKKGDLRSHKNSVYRLTGEPAFGSYEPGTVAGNLGWTKVKDC